MIDQRIFVALIEIRMRELSSLAIVQVRQETLRRDRRRVGD